LFVQSPATDSVTVYPVVFGSVVCRMSWWTAYPMAFFSAGVDNPVVAVVVIGIVHDYRKRGTDRATVVTVHPNHWG
jgi:hypothetical protein